MEYRPITLQYTTYFMLEELVNNENLLRDYYANQVYENENNLFSSFS